MDNALGVERARDHLYEKNAGRPYEEWEPVENYVGAFGLRGILRAGRDPTEQFIGRYKVEIFPQPDKTLRFEVTNTTSMESFLYGLGPEYEREDFPYGGNMKQLITWTEPAIIPE